MLNCVFPMICDSLGVAFLLHIFHLAYQNYIFHLAYQNYIYHVMLHIFHIFASIYVMLCYIFSIFLHAALCYLWFSFINVYYFMLRILQLHFIHLIVLCFYICLHTAYLKYHVTLYFPFYHEGDI